MPKKPEIDEKDQALFRDSMRGIKPLRTTKITPNPPAVAPRKRIIRHEEPEEDPFSDYETLSPVGSDELLSFARPGIQHKILRNLRNGKYNVEATLDLHGKTVMEARTALHLFLVACQQHGIRHALVIHGKGRSNAQPILKNKLNHWLRQTEQVLAFCSATIRDGRSGALYVLLKRE